MVQPRHDDLVVRAKLGRQRPAQHEGERGHVVAEDDLVRRGAQQVGRGLARIIDGLVAEPAGGEDAVCVGVAPRHVLGHGVHHRLVHLRAARIVKEDGGFAVVALGQGRKLLADGQYV